MLIEGYIEFKNEIPVSAECLGQQYPIMIAGFEGLLTTPRMFDGFSSESSNKLGPLQHPLQDNHKIRNGSNWGFVNSWPEGYSFIKACTISFHNIDKDAFEQTGIKLSQEIHNWRNLLIDNISLMLVKDYRRPQSVIECKPHGSGEFGLFQKIGENNYSRLISEAFNNRTIELELEQICVFDKKGLQHVLDDTSKGNNPLLPFYFLFDAESSNNEKNFRKSILDSATAVEVCFSFLISKLLSVDNNLNNYIASKHNSLRLKRDLLKVLNVPMPIKENEFRDDLDAVRNRVIHAGYFPTKDEAKTAYKIATETLYSLLPNKFKL